MLRSRRSRRTSILLREPADVDTAIQYVALHWRIPAIELQLPMLPLSEVQRAQVKLRRLRELSTRQSGGLVTILVVMMGLFGMVWTWNRNYYYLVMLLPLAIIAGLLTRFVAVVLIRIRLLLVLGRLRRRALNPQREMRSLRDRLLRRRRGVESYDPLGGLSKAQSAPSVGLQRTWSSSVAGVRERYGADHPLVTAISASLPVHDLEESTRFYRELGFQQTWSAQDACGLQIDGHHISLHTRQAGEADASPMLQLLVDDANAWGERVRELGLQHRSRTTANPPGATSARGAAVYLTDPGGVLWQIVEGSAPASLAPALARS